jgi:hypothetical protein
LFLLRFIAAYFLKGITSRIESDVMRLDFLPVDSLAKIAWALADTHGTGALAVADRTIADLEGEGAPVVADAWRGLRSVLEDVLQGRMMRGTQTIH